MNAVYTNVLVRFLLADDEEQHRRAYALVEHVVEQGETLFVPDIVLVELAWVLRSRYRVTRDEIASVLRDLYSARHFSFENPEIVSSAIHAFARGGSRKGDFSDYLLHARARRAGCETTFTFDRALLAEDGFSEPPVVE